MCTPRSFRLTRVYDDDEFVTSFELRPPGDRLHPVRPVLWPAGARRDRDRHRGPQCGVVRGGTVLLVPRAVRVQHLRARASHVEFVLVLNAVNCVNSGENQGFLRLQNRAEDVLRLAKRQRGVGFQVH